MSWTKLERGNDWGFDYLAIKAMSSQRTCSARRRHPFAEGRPVDVKWPDDTVESVTVKHRAGSNAVSDMGRESTTYFQLPGFEKDVNGRTIWVAFDEVKVSDASLHEHRGWVEADPSLDPNNG